MKPYRKNVGIVVFNSKGEVLVGRRVGPYRDNWQYPQGGIDEDEEPKQAAVRELYEEVGIKEVQFVYEAPKWISYDFPKDLDI
ncbi:MAG TPA: NUDIX domain-containing protein, partial [Leptospiraceae bacterium]|nr:NUDIX domain-containing protein [Leptospiraceae bacterium]